MRWWEFISCLGEGFVDILKFRFYTDETGFHNMSKSIFILVIVHELQL